MQIRMFEQPVAFNLALSLEGRVVTFASSDTEAALIRAPTFPSQALSFFDGRDFELARPSHLVVAMAAWSFLSGAFSSGMASASRPSLSTVQAPFPKALRDPMIVYVFNGDN